MSLAPKSVVRIHLLVCFSTLHKYEGKQSEKNLKILNMFGIKH